ncbi:hypothetical protein E1264_08395 [Actinomadura sp. KC216]|uniref:hypothetical protein n=1 Tax=Actinomadura sp. KC216 TaxID=2530370 RepID=UPI00104A9307|nr:hypothetical protein [Actinomadura sp. KC216]TDB89423.1 hypothetical protein E1264_08395 [Actinomadura sp. KC216]
MFADAVTAALAGPLIVAGAAKVLTPPHRLDWPFGSGPLRPPWGPRLTGAAELAAAAAIVAVPGRPAALLALVAYLALTAVAFRLRGTRCACFGPARLASVGRARIGQNLAAALVAAAVLAVGPGYEPAVRTAAAGGAAAATLTAVLLIDRRARRREDAAVPAHPDRPIMGVRIYVTETCPSCRSLRQLLQIMEPARRDAIVMITIGDAEALPEPVTGLGVPCGVAIDASGEQVGSPAEGIGAVKALVDGITVRHTRGAREDTHVG